ncbi:MAG: BatA domain-containing protein [Isosphaeraceae bacterium]
MSALTPLYLLGLLAVAAPILFHLIRRAPKGEVPFSSLMFLSPSPPRLTRRSRLDNILLLLLRAAALSLLAFAFARPFLREAASWTLPEDAPRRTAILVDTSASLRRGDLWNRARAAARRAVEDCGPTEELAVLAFDRTTRPVLTFRESSTLTAPQRRAVALARIDALEPTWASTDLGQGLVDAVAAVEEVADSSDRSARMPRRIVLVSDLQQGGRLDALGQFEWPTDVELDLKSVADDASNAGLQRLAESVEGAGTGPAAEPRVRVFNDAASSRDQFVLHWAAADGKKLGEVVNAYVPPGESRVVRIPRPEGAQSPQSIVLTGDSAPFDNALYVLDEPREEATVLFLGDDRPDNPNGLLFYLMRVFVDTPRRTVKVLAQSPKSPVAADPAHPVRLAVLPGETTPENARRLRDLARAGNTVLYVATRPGGGETLGTLLNSPPRPIEEARSTRDALLGEIAFDHPLFAPFAGPQYSDFTRVHFWKRRKVRDDILTGKGENPARARVIARFEDGDPAVLEAPVERGSVVVMASGWGRADSQLARSSKFVPLMMAMLDRRDVRPFEAEERTVGDRIALLAPQDATHKLTVRKPSGATVNLAPGITTFDQADEPGIYTVTGADAPRSFVVNLDPSESKTSAWNVESLEQFGCRLASDDRKAMDREHQRQLHNAELEGRQKIWRWLILATLGLLIVETGLAGRLARSRPSHNQREGPSS